VSAHLRGARFQRAVSPFLASWCKQQKAADLQETLDPRYELSIAVQLFFVGA
jgi:hypothetical protein